MDRADENNNKNKYPNKKSLPCPVVAAVIDSVLVFFSCTPHEIIITGEEENTVAFSPGCDIEICRTHAVYRPANNWMGTRENTDRYGRRTTNADTSSNATEPSGGPVGGDLFMYKKN